MSGAFGFSARGIVWLPEIIPGGRRSVMAGLVRATYALAVPRQVARTSRAKTTRGGR